MNIQTLKHLAMKWIEAYNSHDTDALVSLYDVNATNLQYPWGKETRGPEAMRNTFNNVFQAFPDIHIEAKNIIAEGDWIVIAWRFSGTMKGTFSGSAPNNNSFDMHGCEMFQIANGKIRVQRGYWDKSTMFRQLKINPDT